MAETFENLEDILPDWTQDDIEESLAQAVNLYEKQEERKNEVYGEEKKLLELPWIRRSTVKRLGGPCLAADAVSGVLREEARRDIKILLPLFI